MKLQLVAFLLSIIVVGSSSHNILVFWPIYIWSHYIQVEPILLALADRGHNLTVYSPFPPKKEVPRFHHTFLKTSTFETLFDDVNVIQSSANIPHPLFKPMMWAMAAEVINDEILQTVEFQDLIRNNSDHRYDLIIAELFFGTEAFAVLSHKLGAPVISYATYGYDTKMLHYAGARSALAYLPGKQLDYPSPMTLFQRLESSFTNAFAFIYNEYWYYPGIDALLAKYVAGPLPPITSMLKHNLSLQFFTSDIILDGSRLLPPTIVELSGIQIKAPAPLSKDLKAVMDKSTNGVIYFSFGSLVKASEFKKEDINLLLGVFKKLDQTVLWKTDFNSTEKELPNNVILRDWFDQGSILSHPNCVLFFTHGGISSMMEAINFDVPVLGMPILGDQVHNLAFAEKYGYGLTLKYKDLSHDSLLGSIKMILGNPNFKQNIERASRIFRDRPMSGVDKAVYWIEYVIRHDGAHHLKPVTLQMPWYQEFLLDVSVIFITTLAILVYILLKIILFVLFLYQKFSNQFKKEKEKKN